MGQQEVVAGVIMSRAERLKQQLDNARMLYYYNLLSSLGGYMGMTCERNAADINSLCIRFSIW